MSDGVTIRFEAPNRGSPGFLRRQRESTKYQIMLMRAQKKIGELDALEDKDFDQVLEALEEFDGVLAQTVEFLLPFVIEPEDREQAREELLDLSQEDFDAMLAAAKGIEPEADPENPTG